MYQCYKVETGVIRMDVINEEVRKHIRNSGYRACIHTVLELGEGLTRGNDEHGIGGRVVHVEAIGYAFPGSEVTANAVRPKDGVAIIVHAAQGQAGVQAIPGLVEVGLDGGISVDGRGVKAVRICVEIYQDRIPGDPFSHHEYVIVAGSELYSGVYRAGLIALAGTGVVPGPKEGGTIDDAVVVAVIDAGGAVAESADHGWHVGADQAMTDVKYIVGLAVSQQGEKAKS